MRRAVAGRRRPFATAIRVAQPVLAAATAVVVVGSSAAAFSAQDGYATTARTTVQPVSKSATNASTVSDRAAAADSVSAESTAMLWRSTGAAVTGTKVWLSGASGGMLMVTGGDRAMAGSGTDGSTRDLTVVTADSEREPALGETDNGMPVRALQAYRQASAELADDGCTVPWYLLAGIGLTESAHGQTGEAVLGADGRSTPLIRGPVLNGVGNYAAIADSDDGRLDGDTTWDRAVGPMQFVPQTWASYAADGDDNGIEDPYDLDDAAMAAGQYLCVTSSDLTDVSAQRAALFTYNHSDEYVLIVSAYADAYRRGDWPTVPASALPALQDAASATTEDASNDGAARPRRARDADGDSPRHQPKRDRDELKRDDPKPDHKPQPDPKPDGTPRPDPQPQPNPNPGPSNPGPSNPGPSNRDPSPPTPTPTPTPPPEPELVTSTVTGLPSKCTGGWCVDDVLVGALSRWTEQGDLDQDCKDESGGAELKGLAKADVSVSVSIQQVVLEGVAQKPTIKGFSIPKPPDACVQPNETNAAKQ